MRLKVLDLLAFPVDDEHVGVSGAGPKVEVERHAHHVLVARLDPCTQFGRVERHLFLVIATEVEDGSEGPSADRVPDCVGPDARACGVDGLQDFARRLVHAAVGVQLAVKHKLADQLGHLGLAARSCVRPAQVERRHIVGIGVQLVGRGRHCVFLK